MAKLFDFKFEHLHSKKIIKILYVIFVAAPLIYALEAWMTGENPLSVFWWAIFPGYPIYWLLIRLIFENWLVRFLMAADIKEIRLRLPALRETSAVRETSALKEASTPTPEFKRFNGYEIKHHAILIGANLVGLNLRNADLVGANLSNANLSDADLTNSNLSYANLSYSNLSGAVLTGANLVGANLTGATMPDGTIQD